MHIYETKCGPYVASKIKQKYKLRLRCFSHDDLGLILSKLQLLLEHLPNQLLSQNLSPNKERYWPAATSSVKFRKIDKALLERLQTGASEMDKLETVVMQEETQDDSDDDSEDHLMIGR